MKLDTFFGLDPISRKKYLISNLITYFRFPRASVRYYISVILFLAFNNTILTAFRVLHIFQGGRGVGGQKYLSGKIPGGKTVVKLKAAGTNT